MSAIWGMVDFGGNEIPLSICQKMNHSYENKKIDEVQSLQAENYYMACGLQWIHKESKEEKYPYINGEKSIMVADAIVDNRKELQEIFTFSDFSKKTMADGSILFDCLKENFEHALQVMLGAYGFAYYDREAETLYLVSDAVGNRSIYYRYENGKISFSTLMDALIEKGKEKVNENWFFRFFSQDSLQVVKDANETPYEGVYRVEPGEVVAVDKNGVQKKYYYDPVSWVKPLKLDSDEAYAQKVKEVLGNAVGDVLREGTNTAMLLSGGLDSNSVAAFALPKLKARGEKLYSFTAVPGTELSKQQTERQYYVDDESAYIKEVEKKHDNLVADYVDASEVDLLAISRQLMGILEFPYKAIANLHWIFTAYQKAAEKNCRVILTGQYGNVTISFGEFEVLFITLLSEGKILDLLREIKLYSRRYRKSRKWVLKNLVQSSVTKNPEFMDGTVFSEMKKAEYNQIISQGESKKVLFAQSYKKYREYMYDRVALRQVGESETKLSLETGVIPRDPTRDKRMIELALSLPVKQYVKEGASRRLVRRYLKDLIPEKIASDEFHRGRQGSGSYVNMRKNWGQISDWIRQIYSGKVAKDWIALEEYQAYLGNQNTKAEDLDTDGDYDRNRAMYIAMACDFMEQISE